MVVLVNGRQHIKSTVCGQFRMAHIPLGLREPARFWRVSVNTSAYVHTVGALIYYKIILKFI